ncbi:MAG: VacJ family lipoprotein [Rhodospirillales bacterium]
MRWRLALASLSRVGTVVLAAFLILAGGCATAPDSGDAAAVAEYHKTNDPGEPTNRAIFEVNRGLDSALLKPVATIYRDLTPRFFQDRVNDVLDNLGSPVIFANDILQGEVDRAITTVVRLMINSTIGLLGLFDFATEMGIEGHDEDFGQTLAAWGMPEGPYVMLPIFGPSNPRDTIGLIVDFLIDPLHIWANNTDRDFVIFARGGTRGVDIRATNMEALDDLEKTSLDFYATIRSLYRQRRAEEIRNGTLPADMPAPGLSQSPAGPRLSGQEQALRIH